MLSITLVPEHEDVLHRQLAEGSFEAEEMGNFLDYLCKVGHRQEIFYLWRPVLRAPGDDLKRGATHFGKPGIDPGSGVPATSDDS